MHSKIFIHSLFRTGSTYLWSKFRNIDRYTCYYEPFHNELVGIPKDQAMNVDEEVFSFLKHPSQDKPYFWEYLPFIEDVGVTNFKESFVVDEFCYNGKNEDLVKYIDMLSSNTKINVFQFNRSSLRTKWFKDNYKDSFNIYLYRKAEYNFGSYERYVSEDNTYFSAMDLVIINSQRNQPIFKWLFDNISIGPIESDIETTIEFYMKNVVNLTQVERFMIFYTIWLASLLYNTIYADLVIDINKLSDDVVYRNNIHDILASEGMDDILFDDCSIDTHPFEYALSSDTMSLIKRIVMYNIKNVITWGNDNE